MLPLIFLLILFFFIRSVQAQEVQLEEVVITATRIEEQKKDIPYSVQVITPEVIKTSIAKNTGDLIIESAVGHVSKQPGALTTIYLRGFGGGTDPVYARNLILIDGFRTATINLAEIPINEIKRIEILKGPASVLYGSNAMGGVINIITKEAEKEGVYGQIGVEGGSWYRRKAYGEFKFKKLPFDSYLSLSRSDASDYEAKGYGKYRNTGYNDETVFLRFGYEFLNDQKISFGFRHYRGWDIGSPGSISWLTPRDHIDLSLNCFDVSYKSETFKAGYHLSKRRYEYHEDWGTYLYKTDTQGINLQKTFYISEHRIIIGGEWSRVELENENIPPPPYQPRSKYDNFGLFSEGRFSVDKKFLIFIGFRYDYFENEILSTPEMIMKPSKETLDHMTVRGGVIYKLTDALNIRANAGTGFRAPSPTEYAGEYILWGTKYIGNPSLKPEKSINYEIGITFFRPGFNADFTFFNSVFKDKITIYFDNFLMGYTYKNEEKAKIQGWELNTSYDLKYELSLKFSLEPFANITYHTRYSAQGKPLEATPKWLGAFGVRAHAEKWDARLIANYIGDEVVNYYNPITWSSKIIKKSDFTVVNFKTLYRPIKSLELSFAIENLFDRKYEYVLDYPMPRRTFTVGMKWLF